MWAISRFIPELISVISRSDNGINHSIKRQSKIAKKLIKREHRENLFSLCQGWSFKPKAKKTVWIDRFLLSTQCVLRSVNSLRHGKMWANSLMPIWLNWEFFVPWILFVMAKFKCFSASCHSGSVSVQSRGETPIQSVLQRRQPDTVMVFIWWKNLAWWFWSGQ